MLLVTQLLKAIFTSISSYPRYLDKAADTTQLPYIVYTVNNTDTTYTFEQNIEDIDVEFNIYASSASEMTTIMEYLETLYQRKKLVVDEGYFICGGKITESFSYDSIVWFARVLYTYKLQKDK